MFELAWPSVADISDGVAEPVAGWLVPPVYCWEAKSADDARRSHWAVHELHVSSEPSTAGPSTLKRAVLDPLFSVSANLHNRYTF